MVTKDINAIFWSYVILFTIKFIISLFLGHKDKILTFDIHIKKLKAIWQYSAPISIAGGLGFFLERIDMIILSSQLSIENFAFYSMGCLIIPPLLLLETSVQKVLVPSLASAFQDNDKEAIIYHYKKAQEDIAYLIIPAVFGLMIFSRPIIEILFTSRYIESASFLKIFALSYLAYIIPHDSIPRASGHTNWILKIYMILTPLSLFLIYYSAKHYGAEGALIASTFLKFVPKIPGLSYSAKIAKVRMGQLMAWKPLGFFIVTNCFLTLICYKLKPFFSNEKLWFIILSPFYAAIYLCLANTSRRLQKIIKKTCGTEA